MTRRPAGRGLAALGLALWAALSACGPADGPGLARGRVTIQGTTVDVDVARTPAERTQGLSGRASLPPGEGMLFLHEQLGRHGYWMRDMHFAIDILWLRAGRVVDVAHRVPPPPAGTPESALQVYQPGDDADAVLEVPGGFARTHGWDVGTRARIEIP